MKKILWTLLLIFSVSLPANSQPALTPMVGKAFADNNGASAIRMGMGLNNVYRDRWGVYYTYEYRSNIMFFENTAYGKNEYRRDVAGISCKVHPNFMVYGGVGLFMDGILKGQLQSKGGGIPWVIKSVGLRKEIGVTFHPQDLPIQLSAGYSLSIGFTGNLGWSIPLETDLITVHQALVHSIE